MSLIPFAPFSGDDVGIGEVGAVFEAFVFEPEPSRWEASETDGQAERPTECGKRRSQHVEAELESPASPMAALRVALRQFFVSKALETLGLDALMSASAERAGASVPALDETELVPLK